MANKFGGLMPFGPQSLSQSANPMASMFYSMGMPVYYKGQTRSVYEDMFRQNMQAGRNPYQGFPSSMIPGGAQQQGGGGNPNIVDFIVNSPQNKMRGGLMGLNYRLGR